MSLLARRRVTGPSGAQATPAPPPSGDTEYPLLGTCRQSGFGYTQSGTLAENDRKAIGLMDVVLLGGFFGTPQDDTPPSASYISRTDVTQEILDAHFNAFGTNDIYVCTYVIQMTAGLTSDFGTKCYAETGPNGTDWWMRNSSGDIVNVQGESPGSGGFINLSDEVTLDSSGRTYCDYYADIRVIPDLMDLHAAAGIGAGEGGMSPWYDNLYYFMKKSGMDPDQDGSNDDQQDYYDPDDAAHVAAQPKAVQFMGEARATQRAGIERVETAHPGILKGGNSNQYNQAYSGVATNLPYAMKEYRLDPDDIDSKAFQQIGISENNNWRPTEEKDGYMRSHVLWTGVSSDNGNEWQESYNNIAMPTWNMTDPAIQMGEWIVDCLQPSTDGPAGKPIFPNVPKSGSALNMERWGHATNAMAGSHHCCSGVIDQPTSTTGERQNTPLFDEMGLINGSTDYGFGTGSTKLYRKWMGKAVDTPQTAARQGTWIWMREFDNCLVIINTNWDDTDPDVTIDVSALPGGASEWTRFLGTQDSTWNDGTAASSDFNMPSIDAIFLVRKDWYNQL